MTTSPTERATDPTPQARALMAGLLADAQQLAGAGIATPADIDTAMRLGAGHPAGPFQVLGGSDGTAGRAAETGAATSAWTGPIALVGAGLMASGIAEAIARTGREVRVITRTPESFTRLQARVRASTGRQVERGRITPDAAAATLAALRSVDPSEVGSVDVLIEAVAEDLQIKTAVLHALDGALSPQIAFATNTSSYRVADLAPAVESGRPVLALHFFNPAAAMKLVEVVAPDALTATAAAWVRAIGKTPVACADTRGFVVNRLLIPFLNDAVATHAAGTPAEQVDRVMTDGAAHPMGPLALVDLIGVDVTVAALVSMAETDPDPRLHPADLLRSMAANGRLGRKSGHGFYDYA